MSAPLLDPDDMAAHWGVPRTTVMEWARRYGWPRIAVGRSFRWTPEMVAEIERAHAVTPAGVAPKDGRTMRSARRAS